MFRTVRLLQLCAMLLLPGIALSQDGGRIVVTPDSALTRVTLHDGSVIVGRVLAVNDSTARIQSSFGETTLRLSGIAKVQVVPISALHEGEFWPEDPGRTRLLFAPTGRMLRHSEAYFTDAYVFLPGLQAGLTDNLSLGGGVSLIPGLGPDEQLFFLTPKVGVYSSASANVAVGALLLGVPKALDEHGIAGIGYAVATLGDEDNSVTVGTGVGFAPGARSSLDIFMLGGSTRLSKNIALISENYVGTAGGSAGLFSGGVRFIGEKLSVDLALWGASGASAVIPYVAFIYRM